MCWSDVTLVKTVEDVEFIVYSERQRAKTLTGVNASEVRPSRKQFYCHGQ